MSPLFTRPSRIIIGLHNSRLLQLKSIGSIKDTTSKMTSSAASIVQLIFRIEIQYEPIIYNYLKSIHKTWIKLLSISIGRNLSAVTIVMQILSKRNVKQDGHTVTWQTSLNHVFVFESLCVEKCVTFNIWHLLETSNIAEHECETANPSVFSP